MKIVQRILRGFLEENLSSLLACIEQHPDCMNTVWLSTQFGYPSLAVHKKAATELAVTAKKLREAGLTVDLQLSNSIGHGAYMAHLDCSALVYQGSPVRKLVGHNGTVAEYSFCWNDETFRSYTKELVKYYVEAIRPSEFWIDDDLRARNHAPVDFGCFCEDCIASFNKKHGYSFTREALVREFLHGDVTVRAQYIEKIREDLASFTREISEVVAACSPETVVSLQNGPNGPYTGYGHGYILDAMRAATGHAPAYRPGAGAYHDHDPNELIEKAYCLSRQCSMLPDYVKTYYPEIENTPDTTTGKTMAGTAFEATLYLASGMTELTFAMLSPREPFSFYEEGFALFSKHAPYWKRLSSVSRTSQAGGICFAESSEPHLCKLAEDEDLYDFNREYYTGANPLLRNGLPLTHHSTDTYILYPDAVRRMQKKELEKLLAANVLTDAECVDYIQSQGIDLGFTLSRFDAQSDMLAGEIYTDHPLNEGYLNEFSPSFFAPGRNNNYAILKAPDACEVLGYYKKIDTPPLSADPERPFGLATVVTETKQGGKWAILSCGLWKNIIPSTQRTRLLNIIDYISGDGMPAKLLSPIQAVLLPRVNGNGQTVAASVVNCTIGEAGGARLLIRRPAAERFFFMSQYNGECELQAEKTDDGYLVTLPTLSPWSIGTVFCN